MQEKQSHMFVSLHLHLPGPSNDVEHSAYRPCVQTASSGPLQMLMLEKTCYPYIILILVMLNILMRYTPPQYLSC